ncbi:MAG: FAD-dependent oxidoreductase [Flavobacteriales bacterium]|nr:FAD-dependent oxidoreductase [Flavobacteriales bacterium]
MTRKEFIKICGLLGVVIPFQASCVSSNLLNLISSKFTGKVIIIGAGAGGLSAGYLLNQLGVDFEILEASSEFGGRMKINTDFADFPIPLGAEWIETKIEIFSEILNDDSVQLDIKTIKDSPDYKFVNSSWFNFYGKYIVPSISDKIVFNSVVNSINYSGAKIRVFTSQGQKIADKVIVCVPLKILQAGDIEFIPSLSKEKQSVIKSALIWDGFKGFFEFSKDFYDSGFEKTIENSEAGQKIFYDASFGQNSDKKIIGLFAVGDSVDKYKSLSKSKLLDVILKELDILFSNQATTYYKKHIIQNWNNEPFIRGGYLTDHMDWREVRKLGESINSKVYFAGGEYTDGENWVSVHAAAQSAKKAIDDIFIDSN